MAQLRADIAGYEASLSGRAKVEQLVAELAKESTNELRGYLIAQEPTMAAAELQQYLRRLIDKLGGAFRSARVVRSTPEDELIGVGVESRLEIDHEGLRELFYEIETAETIFFIEAFLVRDLSSGRRTPLDAEAEDLLDVTLTVRGFLSTSSET